MTAIERFWNEIAEVIPFTVDSTTAIKMYDKLQQAIEMEKEQREKLWTNEEVFDMLYKTDKFLMIELREYWKTIEK